MGGVDASTLYDFRLDNYFHLFAIMILYYDYLLTLDDEIELVWKTPLRKSHLLFFVNRYLPYVGSVAVTWSLFDPSLSDASCQVLFSYRNGYVIFIQCFGGALLSQRVYAMYGCSRQILTFLIGFALIMIGAASFLTFSHNNSVTPFMTKEGCHAPLDATVSLQVASAWEALFVYDLVLLGFTLFRARQNAYDGTQMLGSIGGRVSLMQVLVSDGSLYFVVVDLSNAINIVSFYATSPAFRGGLAMFASCVSVCMMSRLMLNLRAANRETEWSSFSNHSLRFANGHTALSSIR